MRCRTYLSPVLITMAMACTPAADSGTDGSGGDGATDGGEEGKVTIAGTADLGTVEIGKTATATLTLTNAMTSTVSAVALTGLTAPLTLTSDCPADVAPAATCTITVTFAPLEVATVTQVLSAAFTHEGVTAQATLSSVFGRLEENLAAAKAPLGNIAC